MTQQEPKRERRPSQRNYPCQQTPHKRPYAICHTTRRIHSHYRTFARPHQGAWRREHPVKERSIPKGLELTLAPSRRTPTPMDYVDDSIPFQFQKKTSEQTPPPQKAIIWIREPPIVHTALKQHLPAAFHTYSGGFPNISRWESGYFICCLTFLIFYACGCAKSQIVPKFSFFEFKYLDFQHLGQVHTGQIKCFR